MNKNHIRLEIKTLSYSDEAFAAPKAIATSRSSPSHARGWTRRCRRGTLRRYHNAAYFNREYKSLFGLPPMRDIERLQSNPMENVSLKPIKGEITESKVAKIYLCHFGDLCGRSIQHCA